MRKRPVSAATVAKFATVACPALSFSRSADGSVGSVVTSEGRITTRYLVLAAGIATPKLVNQIDPALADLVPINQVPGLLVETQALDSNQIIERVYYPPDTGRLHLRPTPSGGVLIGAEDIDSQVPEDSSTAPLEFVENLLVRTEEFLPAIKKIRLEKKYSSRICVRPVPINEMPIVGQLPGVPGAFVAVMHSGVTLGPLIGKLLSHQIHAGDIPELLIPYSPSRSALDTTF